MKQKSLLALLTLTLLMATSIVYADVALTAELSDTTYNPCEIVTISGNLTGVSAPVEVEIEILNGTDLTLIHSFSVDTVADTDNITATYDLTGAVCGDYIVNVTYGDLYVELEFEVEPKEVDDTDDCCDDLSFAIERAEIYLERVRAMLEEYNLTYGDIPSIYEKLQELNATLDLAEEYLINATIALEEGDCSMAAKYHAAARNLLGRANGILNSVIKEHKVERAEKFMEQFQRRLNSTQDKVDQLQYRLGVTNSEKVKTNLGNAYGQIKKLEGTVTLSNVDDVIKGLRKAKGQVDDEIDDLDDEEVTNTIKNMNRYDAKICALNKTQVQLQRKGANTDALKLQIRNAESLLNQLKASEDNDDNDLGLETELDNAKDAAKDLRKSQTNKGNSNSNKGNSISSSRVKATKPKKAK